MDTLATNLAQPGGWLPLVFLVLMGVAMLAYVLLDGYDLGVGILLRNADDSDKDMMIASIGPFWDANETWLVLGVGIMLTVFPFAHGIILGALYLPVALMLIGLILRGVSFDFRAKARAHHKRGWNQAFFSGSLLTALSQGWMLGSYIIGFRNDWAGLAFAAIIAFGLASGYALLGACWLIMKTEGALQRQAVRWAQRSLWLTGIGIAVVSIVTPLISPRIFEKWFAFPNLFALAPVPLFTAALFGLNLLFLHRLSQDLASNNALGQDRWCWAPFACTVGIFVLAFNGLAYSLFPYLVVDRIDIWQAASAPEALKLILIGALIVLPAIIGYTIFAYRVFWGKASELSYD